MAQRVTKVCDLSGDAAHATRAFSVDGRKYTIDLSEPLSAAFDELLAPYVAAAQSLTPEPRSGRPRVGGTPRSRKPSAVRTWARDNGFEVPERGRLGAEITKAYEAAHPGESLADA